MPPENPSSPHASTPPSPPPRPRGPVASPLRTPLRALARVLPAVAAAMAVLAAGDLAGMAGQAHRFLDGPRDVAAAGLAVAAVHLWTGLWVALAAATLLWLATGGDPDGALARARVALAALARGTDVRPGARVLGALAGLALFFVLVAASSARLAEAVNTPALLGLAAAGIAVVALAAAAVAAIVAARVLERLGPLPGLRHLLASRTVTGLAGLLLAAGGVVAVAFERAIFKEIDGWRLYLPALGLAAAAAVLLFRPVPAPSRRRRVAAFGLAFAAVAVTATGLLWAGRVDGARALFLSFGRNGAQAAGLWSRAFDFDGDGASTFLGGRDCDPWDPLVYPGAPEVVDNGIDEDCQDGDLRSAPPALRQPKLTRPLPDLKHPDVLLISIDGCRRDALGAYGAPSDRTPRLDALAAESVVFDDAIAPASWTNPSFAAILTGRYAGEIPGFYGASRFRVVPDDIPLLFKPFAEAGYRTVAVTAGIQLDKLGLDRDLDDWHSIAPGPRGRFARPVADLAIEVLSEASRDEPLFLWVHLIDPHYPYDPPPAHRRFGDDRRGLYAGEVAFADEQVGRLLDALRDAGRAPETVVAFFADHGEAFREHGREFHGESVYGEEVRVPLMFRVPGVAPARRPDLASTLDLGPTLWDLAGLARSLPTRGISLAPSIVRGTAPSRRYVFSEQTRTTQEFALTSAAHRLRWDRTLHRYELFDRASDPDEQQDVSRELWHVARQMRAELARTMSAIDAVANRNLGDVLLRAVPDDCAPVDDAFLGGPEFAAFRAARDRRKVEVQVVLRSRGPLKDAGKVEIRLDARAPDDASLGSGRREIAGGTYAPARWRAGDLVRHRGDLTLKRDPPPGSRICVSLVVDQTPLALQSDDIRRCFDLP